MALDDYLWHLDGLIVELRDEVTTDDLERLVELLSRSPRKDFVSFAQRNEKEILTYLRQTPSVRKKKKWKNDEHALLVRTHALRRAKIARSFLHGVIANKIQEGCSYRKMLHKCATASLGYEDEWLFWPFDECPAPWLG